MMTSRTLRHVDARDQARRAILGYVHRFGPSAIPELPARWPVTRFHVRRIVHELARDGLVAHVRVAPFGPPLVRITEAGRASLSDRPQPGP